jgi:hypothetical protein
MFNRKIFFDTIRGPVFAGSLTQGQVDGMNYILAAWEANPRSEDLRWLAYALATTKHETANTMLPVEEYGRGQGYDYGKTDPDTGQAYYGRGFVQLTWRGNYAKTDYELGLAGDDSCEWHADNALKPDLAAEIMFQGMTEGWFRPGRTLTRYFSDTVDKPFEAREIINGDKYYTPRWANGQTIGEVIATYHRGFLAGLEASLREAVVPTPEPAMVVVSIETPPGVVVRVIVNQEEV